MGRAQGCASCIPSRRRWRVATLGLNGEPPRYRSAPWFILLLETPTMPLLAGLSSTLLAI